MTKINRTSTFDIIGTCERQGESIQKSRDGVRFADLDKVASVYWGEGMLLYAFVYTGGKKQKLGITDRDIHSIIDAFKHRCISSVTID